MSARKIRPVAVVGSTARDFPAYLSEALDACLRRDMIPVMAEHLPADDPRAVEAALGLLDEADVYIGLLSEADEPSLPGADRSLTELEYDHASARGIPRLMFTVGPRRSNATSELDAGGGDAGLEAFIRRIGAKRVRPADSPKEFRALLLEDLTALGVRGQTRTRSKTSETDEYLPRTKGGGDGNAKSAQPKTSPETTSNRLRQRTSMESAAVELEAPAVGKSKQTFRVFVASPGDVQDERSRLPKVVESLNKTLGKLLNVVVELWRWEADAPPAVGEPQALINPELDAADVVLVILWNRFGTPTAAGTTGTESEVLRSLQRWDRVRRPQVMVYFCQRPALLNREGLAQRLKLLDFRERLAPLVLAADYGEVQEFEWRVRDDLFLTIATLCVKRK